MNSELTWNSNSTKTKIMQKSQYELTLYWEAEPSKILTQKLKGIPILNIEFGYFDSSIENSTNQLELNNIISSNSGNIIKHGTDEKLYAKEDDSIDFLAYYILAKS